jgi:hypothetical protein
MNRHDWEHVVYTGMYLDMPEYYERLHGHEYENRIAEGMLNINNDYHQVRRMQMPTLLHSNNGLGMPVALPPQQFNQLPPLKDKNEPEKNWFGWTP